MTHVPRLLTRLALETIQPEIETMTAIEATREWKRELHQLLEKRDERIADLEDQLVTMTTERDYWRETAEANNQTAEALAEELNTIYDD